MKTYHNTTDVTGTTLEGFTDKAKNQDEKLLFLFEYHKRLTPKLIEVYTDWPRSSIARSLNTLTKKGLIEKTADKMTSKYKRPEHIWKLNG